jgi:Winged helix DNA-binding domain
VTNRAIALARLRNSRLVGAPLDRPEDVAAWFGAVQSQDVPGALWGLAQRLPSDAGTTIDSVGAAMDEGRIVRTHAMRPTWHFLAPDDLRWIQALTAPRVLAQNRGIERRVGLDGATFARAEDAMRNALAGGRAMTREELGRAVGDAGVDGGSGVRLAYLAMHAELGSVICNGPRRGKQATYQLVDERVPPTPARDRDAALAELALRYFRSHGPALAHDMAWWSGLTVGDVRRGAELAGPSLEKRSIEGRDYWAAAGGFEPAEIHAPVVLLLPNYDEYLGSYVDYDPVFDPALPKARNVADVLGAHIVVRDGFVVGGWRRAIGPRTATVTVTLLIDVTAPERTALEGAAEAFGRFLGLPVELVVGLAA